MALTECVDCGEGLSPTTTKCNRCNSRDPLGVERTEIKVKISLIIFFIFMIGIYSVAHYFT